LGWLAYGRSYPKVKIRFVEAVGQNQLTLLERGDCDIGIGIGSPVRQDAAQATFVEGDNVIQAFAANRADEALEI
jgi:DNA-binding transcriptional LysR family regulator